MSKAVVFLCGLIGSGKTTFVRNNFKVLTDLDYTPPYSAKINQIQWAENLLKEHDEACHIACYPKSEEIKSFKGYNIRYLLINPNLNQARTNTLIRSRPRDMENLKRVFDANKGYLRKYQKANIRWEIIWYE